MRPRDPRPAALALLVWLLAAPAALADAPTPAAGAPAPGNYCVSCHSAGDDRPAHVLDWAGGLEDRAASPCPAAVRVREEVYYTERLLLASDRARAALPPGSVPPALTTRLAAARQTYSRLLDTPVTSVDATAAEAQNLRYSLGKAYSQLNALADAGRERRVLLAAGLVTLLVLGSLAGGLRTTRRVTAGAAAPLRLGLRPAGLLALVLVLFALPVFRQPVAAPDSATTEDLARQAALDLAGRAATAGDRGLARAWMLGQVAAARAPLDPEQGRAGLEAALAAARSAQQGNAALWGEAEAAHEGAIGAANGPQQAAVPAARLALVRDRAWPWRLIAEAWAPVDPARAAAVLDEAERLALAAAGPGRDLDLHNLAVSRARLDATRAASLADQVRDPALRAWAFSDLAGATGDRSFFLRAVRAGREVIDLAERARVLAALAVRTGDTAVVAEAATAADGLPARARSTVLAVLSGADPAQAGRLDGANPATRALALYRGGRYEAAWKAAGGISDPYERARAQAAIAAAWRNLAAARQIADATLRDRALAAIAVGTADRGLAGEIAGPYYRTEALAALGDYAGANQAAAGLTDFFPLRRLAEGLAAVDPQAALALLDRMDREVDKAAVLRAVAAGSDDPALFRRALDMALAARVRSDARGPVVASLDLAQAVAPHAPAQAAAALTQASAAAQAISLKYR